MCAPRRRGPCRALAALAAAALVLADGGLAALAAAAGTALVVVVTGIAVADLAALAALAVVLRRGGGAYIAPGSFTARRIYQARGYILPGGVPALGTGSPRALRRGDQAVARLLAAQAATRLPGTAVGELRR